MEAENRKNALFETMDPLRALAVMALPTVASQMIILLYNLADTWFIGRTNDPCMIGASSLGLTVYLAVTALANVFGTGGGSLMARLTGEKRTEDARRVVSYSVAAAALSALAFSLLVLVRHIALIIPVMLVMDRLWGITGLIWSQLIADLLNAVVACLVFRRVDRGIRR